MEPIVEMYLSSAFSFLSFFVEYFFLGIGLSRLASAIGCPRPWLSWIPFGRLYLLGAVADLYTDNRMTSEADRAAPFYAPSNLRRKMLGYGIGRYITGIVAGVAYAICAMAGVLFFFLLLGGAVSGEADPAWISDTLFLITGLVAFVGGALWLLMTILFLTAYFPALTRVLTVLGAPSPSLMTVISIFFPVLEAILIFVYTRRTEGLSEKFAPPTF